MLCCRVEDADGNERDPPPESPARAKAALQRKQSLRDAQQHGGSSLSANGGDEEKTPDGGSGGGGGGGGGKRGSTNGLGGALTRLTSKL